MIYQGKELYHYGIKGQKHGVRRWQNEDGSYTAQGRTDQNGHGRYSKIDEDSDTTNETKKKFKLSDNQKKALKIGVAIVGAALVAYGGYKIYENRGMIKNYMNLGKKNVDFIRNSGKFDYLDKRFSGANIKAYQKMFDDISVKELDSIAENLNPLKKDCNCQSGVLAFDSMMKGVKASALDVDTRKIDNNEFVSKVYKNIKGDNIMLPLDSIKEVEEKLVSLGDGTFGRLGLYSNNHESGHALGYLVNNGKVHVYDNDSRRIIPLDLYANVMESIGKKFDLNDVHYLRTDNLEYNDFNFINQMIKFK